MSLFIMSALMSAFAWAGAGPVDTANTLPYVLLIEIIKNDGSSAYCTGTALSADTVVTAAHCALPYDLKPKQIRIYDQGYPGSSDAHYVTSAFAATPRNYVLARPAVKAAKKASDVLIPLQVIAGQDVAVLTVLEDLRLKSFAKPLWRLFPEHETVARRLIRNRNGTWSFDETTALSAALKRSFPVGSGPFGIEPRRAVSAGFGLHPKQPGETCVTTTDPHFLNQDACQDFKRRINGVKLEAVCSNAQAALFTGEVFCTTSDRGALVDERHGDSGGPLFLQANDGQFYFAGVLARSDGKSSQFASVLQNLGLIFEWTRSEKFPRDPWTVSLGLQLAERAGAVVVSEVKPKTLAALAGLQAGDVLMYMDIMEPITTLADAERYVSSYMGRNVPALRFFIQRGSQRGYIEIDVRWWVP